MLKHVLLIALFISGSGLARLEAQSVSNVPKANFQGAPAGVDGQRDFDFEIGTWKTKLKRLRNPLTGSTTWINTRAPRWCEKFGMVAQIWLSST